VGDPAAGPRAAARDSIDLVPPPSLPFTSPVAGIAFGSAPFLWPVFLALDAVLLVAAATVLRRRWRRAADD
jgi:hypothetical protein